MANGVVEKTQVAAKTNEPLNRAGVYTAAVQNGMVFQEGTRNADAVWEVVAPATGSFNNLWMVADSGTVLVTDAQGNEYSGLTNDPSVFGVAIGRTFSMFKPQIDDIIVMSADALGTYAGEAYAVATNGNLKLDGAGAAIDGLSLELLETTKINIPARTFGAADGVTAYRFKVVAI